jgi:hypothetical protein
MLQIEKIKFNILNLVHYKNKKQNIKLTSDNKNTKNDLSTNTIPSVPSLKDMEFNWRDDY